MKILNSVQEPQNLQQGWKISDLIHEAMHNTLVKPSPARWLLYLAVVLAVALTTFRALEIINLEARISEQKAEGRNIVYVQSTDPSNPVEITRTSCEALTELAGVETAGALEQQLPRSFPQFGSGVSIVATSTTLFPQLRSYDLAFGVDLIEAEELDSMRIYTDSLTYEATKLPRAPNGIPVNNAVVYSLPSSTRTTENCLIQFDQRQRVNDALPDALAQLHIKSGTPATIAVVPSTSDPFSEFLTRPTLGIPMLLGAAFGSMLLLTVRLRSSEFATYRMSGTNRDSILLLIMFEGCWIASVYSSAGVLASTVASHFTALNSVRMFYEHVGIAALVLFCSAGAASLVAYRSALDLAKER